MTLIDREPTVSAREHGTDGSQAGHGLRANALGTRSIAFLVIAAAAPLTVMAGVAPLAILVGGIGAPLGYLAAGMVLTLFAVGFMAMTRHTGGAGALLLLHHPGLGRPPEWRPASSLSSPTTPCRSASTGCSASR